MMFEGLKRLDMASINPCWHVVYSRHNVNHDNVYLCKTNA